NIGDAHSEGFLDIRQKVNEKLKLFVHSGLLIFGADSPDLNTGVNTFANNVRRDDLRLFSWSSRQSASLEIISIEKKYDHAIITAYDQRTTNNTQPISITI